METEKYMAELRPALMQLEVGLSNAKSQLNQSSRDAAHKALCAVINFIGSIPELDDQHLTTPLWPLATALNDLDGGRVAEILKPRPGVSNRSPEPFVREVVKTFCIFS